MGGSKNLNTNFGLHVGGPREIPIVRFYCHDKRQTNEKNDFMSSASSSDLIFAFMLTGMSSIYDEKLAAFAICVADLHAHVGEAKPEKRISPSLSYLMV